MHTEHYEVRRIAVHLFLVKFAVEDLHISAAAVDVLLVLHCELNDERFALVAHRLLEFGGCSVESRIGRSMQTCQMIQINFFSKFSLNRINIC